MNKELLEVLYSAPSPSGYELDLQKNLINYLKDVDDVVITNQNYNVVHGINKDSKKKILFLSHIDEIGLVISEILPNGTCKVMSTGGIRPYMYLGQHVRVLTDNGEVHGVFGYLPAMDKGITVDDLVLDLGVDSKEEALKLVHVGNPVVHQYKYELFGNKISGRALDDKIAAYIFLEALRRVKGKTDLGIYIGLTVGEETTGRGAKAAVNDVKPDCVITADVTYATDIKYMDHLRGDIRLGSGAVLTLGSLMNPVIKDQMVKLCDEKGIKYQYEVAPARTYTDTDSVYCYNGSTPSYLISIPLRYMHSSVEVANVSDVEEIINLVVEYILNFDKNTDFNPFNN